MRRKGPPRGGGRGPLTRLFAGLRRRAPAFRYGTDLVTVETAEMNEMEVRIR